MIEVKNLGDALQKLKDRGMLIIGFDSEAEQQLKPRTGDQPLVIVMGAEARACASAPANSATKWSSSTCPARSNR